MHSKAHMALLEQTLDDADRIGATSISTLALSAPVATKANCRWIAVSPDRWDLVRAGRKLGGLVKVKDSSQWPGVERVDKWFPIPRGGNYKTPHARIRSAALDLEILLGVFSSDASPANRRRAALLP